MCLLSNQMFGIALHSHKPVANVPQSTVIYTQVVDGITLRYLTSEGGVLLDKPICPSLRDVKMLVDKTVNPDSPLKIKILKLLREHYALTPLQILERISEEKAAAEAES